MVKIANQFDKNLFNSQKQKELYQLKFPDLQFIKNIQKTNIQTYLLHHKSEFSLQSLYFYLQFIIYFMISLKIYPLKLKGISIKKLLLEKVFEFFKKFSK